MSIDTSRYLNLPSIHHFPGKQKEDKNGPIHYELQKTEDYGKTTNLQKFMFNCLAIQLNSKHKKGKTYHTNSG